MACRHLQRLTVVCMAFSALLSSATYATISGRRRAGTCVSRGYGVIADVNECRVAGVQLGYQHWPYGITGPGVGSDGGEGMAHPYGCMHGTNLAFNYNQASTQPCDSTCICKVLPPTTTTVTTTTTTVTTSTTTSSTTTTTST